MLVNCGIEAMGREKLIIDTDPGIGEVDWLFVYNVVCVYVLKGKWWL